MTTPDEDKIIPDWVEADLPTEESIAEGEIADLSEHIDPIDAFGALSAVADAFDIDLPITLRKIALDQRLDRWEQVIEDLIAISQSNPTKAALHLLRCALIDNAILDNQD